MPMFKKSLLILLVLALAVLGGTMYGYYREQQTITLDPAVIEQAEAKRTVTVYVCGEVKKPGLVTLTEGQRVADAVNAVGGVIETADIDRINMAALLEDGMQVRVPLRIGGMDERSKSTGTGKNAEGQINLNTATEKELQELPGIGPATRRKLLRHFGSVQRVRQSEEAELTRVVGAKLARRIKSRL